MYQSRFFQNLIENLEDIDLAVIFLYLFLSPSFGHSDVN